MIKKLNTKDTLQDTVENVRGLASFAILSLSSTSFFTNAKRSRQHPRHFDWSRRRQDKFGSSQDAPYHLIKKTTTTTYFNQSKKKKIKDH